MNTDFYLDEVRDGYLVTSAYKKLWAVQLDLLQQFDAFCKKHGLKYFAQGGTLLGVARYKGYIPWDDDIDLIMLWDDYKVLLREGPAFFKEPYFLQNYLTEKEGEPQLSKLRRSNTTGCTKWEEECVTPAFNKGIFIDIFPLFNVPDDETERLKQIEKISYYWKLYKGYEVNREKQLNNGVSKLESKYDDYEKMYLTCFPRLSFREIKRRYIETCSVIESRTKYVAPLAFRANNPKTTWPREWFDETIMLPFEDILLPCPKQYISMLDHQYGNWRIPVQNGAIHEMSMFDTETSYIDKMHIDLTPRPIIRAYESDDFDSLNELLGITYGSNITKEELEKYCITENRIILVSVLNDNTVVGCAFISINQDYVRKGKNAFVTYVAVSESMRHNRIGTHLFVEIEKIAKLYDCTSIELTSANHRAEAHAFYKALSFTKKQTTVFIKEI